MASVAETRSVLGASDEVIDHTCKLCLASGNRKEANLFCQNCDAYICDSCVTAHNRSLKLRKHKILPADGRSVKDKHAASGTSDTFSIGSDSLADTSLYKGSDSVSEDSIFKGSDSISSVRGIQGKKPIPFSQVDVKIKEDRVAPWITGCTVMPNGDVILCDHGNRVIKHLDASLSLRGSLNLRPSDDPWDVARLDTNNVAVSSSKTSRVVYVQVYPNLMTIRYFNVGTDVLGMNVEGKKAYGIDVVADNIYVASGEGCIKVYDLKGELQKQISVDQDGMRILKHPQYVVASLEGDKVFVLEAKPNNIYCVTTSPSKGPRQRYKKYNIPKDSGLISQLCGLFIDARGQICYCGKGKNDNIIYVADAMGKLKEALITPDNCEPCCVSFRTNDGTLLVGCRNQYALLVYKL